MHIAALGANRIKGSSEHFWPLPESREDYKDVSRQWRQVSHPQEVDTPL